MQFKALYDTASGQMFHGYAGRMRNFEIQCKKLVQYVQYNFQKWYIVHLTLTYADIEGAFDHRDLNRVMQMVGKHLERQGAEGEYLAVKEYNSSGKREFNPHYHVLVVYNKAYSFPDWEKIKKSWGRGNIKITAPKLRIKLSTIMGYMGKYLGKGYQYDILEGDKKSFTASRISSIYKLSSKRLKEVRDKVGLYVAEGYKCTFNKVWRLDWAGQKQMVIEWASSWICFNKLESAPF